jgi:bacterioferritin-associated ferredoxin
MYVCHCNALTDRDVARAARAGASRPGEVYAACNCRAQCGNCTRTVLCLLRDLVAPRTEDHQELAAA